MARRTSSGSRRSTRKGPARSEAMAVRRQGHTDLFGIFLASHAVPDSFCLLHAGVGCKTKGQQHLVNQDWIRESFSRTAWSETSDIEVILGSGSRLEAAIRDWIARRSPSVMAVATSAFVELRGEDIAGTIRRAQAGTGCRLLYLPAKGYDGDLYRGYGAYLSALLRTLDWSGARPQGDLVNVLGYLFDRYEMEHRANADELAGLLGGIGLRLHRLFLSGSPYGHLKDAPQAGLQVCLPYLAKTMAPEGRPAVSAQLPIGLHGTKLWLEIVGRAAGLKKGVVDAFVDAQLRRIVPILQPAAERLRGLRVALFSDTPRAAAIASFLVELDARPVLVGLTDRTLGGKKAFLKSAANLEAPMPPDLAIIEDPSPRELRGAADALLSGGGVDILIGSSSELKDLRHLDVPKIEVGLPSYEKHYVYPLPELGFGGALAIVQRLLDALASVH